MRELSKVMRGLLYIGLAMVFGLVFANMSESAVYYMGNPGDDFQSLIEAFRGANRMTGGDTLIIRDGIYEGNDNRVDQFMFPPMGAENNYTVIKAENLGKAIFTNGADISIINFPNNDPNNPLRYIQFEGIKWISTVALYGVHHIKFFHCVFEGDVPEGNTMAFSVGYGSHHVLLEDCIAYGKGRYKFLVYRSSEIVLRRCVGRQDYSNKNREVVPGGPIATFSTYSSWNVEFQNCIAIDGDQPEFWDSATELGGAFYAPISSDGFKRRGCIVLNMAMSGGNSSSSTDTHFEDSIIWDATAGAVVVANGSVSHCTIGNLSTTAVSGINCDIANNILMNSNYGISGISLGGNVLYNNNNNGDVTPQDILDINPLYHPINNPNGGLKYLVRTETGSNLSGKATDGGDPGCNILKRIGQRGTLWGEQGWNEVTDEDLWPWPYEEWIKENMGNYNRGGIDPDLPRGDSGFCAYISPFGSPNTLTSYIWEYLGNPIPPEIYEAVPLTITTTSLPDGTVNQAYSNALEAIGGSAPYTWSVISGSLPDGLALHSSSGLISGTPTTEGVSSFTIEVQDSVLPPDIAIKDLSIVIQLPANVPPELTPIGNKIVNEEELLQFTVTATDSDGDSLVLSCTNIPPSATFTDDGNGTGLFSWIPTYEQAGTYANVHFEASDGELADSEDINITVNNVNRPPLLDPIGDKAIDEGYLLQFTVSAVDPDGDSLSLKCTNVPAGAAFTDNGNGTGLFSWTPTYEQGGTYSNVRFEASDGACNSALRPEQSFSERYGFSSEGLALWLDQSDPRSYGDAGNWHDISGLSDNASQSNVNSQPIVTHGSDFAGYARDFDGSNDHMQVLNSDTLGAAGIPGVTLSMWVYAHSTTGDPVYRRVGFAIKGDSYYLAINNGDLWGYIYTGFTDNQIVTSHAIPTDQWCFLTLVWEPETGKLYYNDAEVGSRYIPGTNIRASQYDVDIGYYTSVAESYLDGLISEVIIFNRALSAHEIQKIYITDKCRYGKTVGDGLNDSEDVTITVNDASPTLTKPGKPQHIDD